MFSHFLGMHYAPAVIPLALFQLLDVLNGITGIALLATFVLWYFPTYEQDKDDFGISLLHRLGVLQKTGSSRRSPWVAVALLYACMFVLGGMMLLFRGSTLPFQIAAFAALSEAMGTAALFPQLMMFHKDKRVSPPLANFVVLTAVSRVCLMLFWLLCPLVYQWRTPKNRWSQITSEAVNLLILSDFLYFWLRSTLRGDKEVIIHNDEWV